MAKPRALKTPSSHHDAVEPLTEWEGFVDSARETRRHAKRLYRRLEARAVAAPGAATAWALAAGFILGGGLFSRLTFRAARAAAVVALRGAGAGIVARGLFEIVPLVEKLPAIEIGKPS